MSATHIPVGTSWRNRTTQAQALEARLPPEYSLDAGCDVDVDASSDVPVKRPRVRYMPPLDAPRLSQVATMSGFLRKQADNEPGKWTQYYFVLKPTTYLYYYTTPHDTEPRGILDVEFLRDVRFNADCVQRSVGGSAHAFRVTGQLPSVFCDDGNSNRPSQLRPVYLDAESREDADAWMDAIRRHRFDLARANDYDDLMATMERADALLTTRSDEMNDLTTTSRRIVAKAMSYLRKLRGMEPCDDEDEVVPSAADALRAVSSLLDDLYAEAERHRRLAELLRERETEHYQREAHLKGCQADLKSETVRRQQLEHERDQVLKATREHERVYAARVADVVAREHDLQARTRELEARAKQHERDVRQKMLQVEQRSAELSKQLKTETARCNTELEKRRKALDKQQQALVAKQMLLLGQRPPDATRAPKVGFVEAVRKSLPTMTPTMTPLRIRYSVDSGERGGEDTPTVLKDQSTNESEMLSPQSNDGENKDSGVASTLFNGASGRGRQETKASTSEPHLELTEKATAAHESIVTVSEELHTIDGALSASEARFTSSDVPSDSSSRDMDVVLDRSECSTSNCVHASEGSPSAAVANDTSAPLPSETSFVHRLPPEWTYRESKSYHGQWYFFNVVTGETRWDVPLDVLQLEDHELDEDDGVEGRADARSFSLDDVDDAASGLNETRASLDVHASLRPMKTPWRRKLMAKVPLPRRSKSVSSSSPRSPSGGATRCEF